MAQHCGWIVAIKLDERIDNAARLQEVLTKHGCAIKVRLGLHETSQDYCANYGVIVLHGCGSQGEIDEMMADLNGVDGVKASSMDLEAM